MNIDENKVIEVIGRLIGRANSHKNSAQQTPDTKKAQAHLSAYEDMISLADDLANATSDPEYCKSRKAYVQAVSQRSDEEMFDYEKDILNVYDQYTNPWEDGTLGESLEHAEVKHVVYEMDAFTKIRIEGYIQKMEKNLEEFRRFVEEVKTITKGKINE